MPAQTTIKVSAATRDRLKDRADRLGYGSLDAYLNALVDGAEREEVLAELRATMASVTHQEWSECMAEVWEWDATLADGLDPRENWGEHKENPAEGRALSGGENPEKWGESQAAQ
jgi:hypothetical protein